MVPHAAEVVLEKKLILIIAGIIVGAFAAVVGW
jgi:hypothetical protein